MRKIFNALLLLPLAFSLFLPLAPAPEQARDPGAFQVNVAQAADSLQSDTCNPAIIHYYRRNADYEGWGLHVWGAPPLDGVVTWSSPLAPAGQDDFGLFWEVEVNEGATSFNYIIHRGDEKDPGPDQTLTFAAAGCEIWQVQGKADQFPDPETALAATVVTLAPAPPLGENQVILHYRRMNEDYDGWGLHIWGPTAVEGITWTSPLLPAGQDEYGLYWIIAMQPDAKNLQYIVHKGDLKDPGPDQNLDLEAAGREIWLVEGSGEQFGDPESAKEGLIAAALGDIQNKAQAHWLSRAIIGWPVRFSRDAAYTLYYNPDGEMRLTPEGLTGGQAIPLEFAGNTLPEDLAARFPHLWNARALQIPAEALDLIPEILKGQLAIQAVNAEGEILATTALQIPGVLDDLYANDEPLGLIWEGDVPILRLWAPTAKSVRLLLYPASLPPTGAGDTPEQEIPLEWNPETGLWSVTGQPGWKGKYYLYDVEVFVRQEGAVVHNLVSDPYSLSLSQNSAASQIVDLADPALMPEGWQTLEKPALAAFTDIVLYELHLRDFSARDESVPAEQRGTYLAFTHPESAGMQHLAWLQSLGVTHLHLLPLFDIATINENKTEWQSVDFEQLASLPPDSEQQQEIVNALRGLDGFNWGYDPLHYTVPEGSYSSDPNGTARIVEFRQMVQALNQTGLRVVMDVVYNHTNASGQSEKAVLDRVVPGYYHRLDENGNVASSTCCANTATEHAMMRRLMIDSVLTWATAYKVDGFRFDLMGHHMKADLEALRAELDALTPESDGVNGRLIYVYGEGWDFGEVADNARGVNATQLNMAGTGIGTFNDRLRDAARGGSPFADQQEQGFATGLFVDTNAASVMSAENQLRKLLAIKDHLRVALAGNLATYELVNAHGEIVTGAEVVYNAKPAGYAASPEENILYVSAHDNETLFDAIQYKAPLSASLEERVRMQSLALSLAALGQGVPFFHAGSEILRSKSMERDSYDSTDWYNAIDWTYSDNNWGHGLPLKDKNGAMWPVIKPLLANPALAPGQDEILMTRALFAQWLQIRASSALFRLRSAERIQQLVRFHNTGPEQIPGLIAMSISDDPAAEIDPNYGVMIVLWNADPGAVEFMLEGWQAGELALHPLLEQDPYASQASYDPATQVFRLPGRSTVVFVGADPLAYAPEAEAAEPTETPTPAPTRTPEPAAQAESVQPTTTAQIEAEIPAVAAESPDESTPIWPWLVGGAAMLAAGAALWFFAQRKKSSR